MTRSRFLDAPVHFAARTLVLRSLPAVLLASLGVQGGALRAQTAPVLEAPAGASTSSLTLLEDGFDVAPEAANAPQPSPGTPRTPSSAAIVPDAGASGARALAWKYVLGRDEPRLSWARAELDLSTANSVELKVKSDAPAAIEVWFETQPQGTGAAQLSARYSTTVWSAGGSWQQLSLDRARFAGREIKGGVLPQEPIPSALWEAGWSHIARWGVADATNAWRLFAGQTRESGPRTLWLDDLKISTAPSLNPAAPAPAAPRPQPAPNEGQQPDGAEPNGGEANNFDGGAAPGGPIGARRGQRYEEAAPAGGQAVARDDLRLTDAQDGADEANQAQGAAQGQAQGQAQGEAAAPAEVAVQAIVQDAWGALESWIPINGSTAALEGERAGLKWSVVRLANRDALLISPVNPETLRLFPPESVRRKPRGAGVVIQNSSERLLRLAIGVATARPTLLQVALYESDGAVWIAPVPVDVRRQTYVPIVRLADFTNAPTRRDANGHIDLDRIVAVSLQDIGAQKSLAGPNDITLHGMTWIY